MENTLLINMVQGQIGYIFKNPDLLLQAFTRSSYASENGGEDNEILEFIGDKALDLAVVNLLVSKYGKTQNKFVCSVDEGKLTQIKSRMVQKFTLARRIGEMGFAEQLFMGKGDIKNHISEEPSVKEDLFEAILGAVVLDCDWDFSKICSVVEAMILPEDFFLNDEDDNYVRMIQDWDEQVNGVNPLFWFKEASYTSTWYIPFEGISQQFPLVGYDYSRLKYHCELKLLDDLPIYRGFGASKSEARMNVCKLAYEDLKKKGIIEEITIRDEIDNPNKDEAISQLEILARRGYFSIPTYQFNLKHDENGNPVWTAECHIDEYDTYFDAVSSSKKDAKKTAAFEMLQFILNKEDD
ncbi:MAG: hypothetical protein K5629_02390 [Eubacteriales bacterium]|nr:hypothetical protein [Eubacteriales bacterium]